MRIGNGFDSCLATIINSCVEKVALQKKFFFVWTSHCAKFSVSKSLSSKKGLHFFKTLHPWITDI